MLKQRRYDIDMNWYDAGTRRRVNIRLLMPTDCHAQLMEGDRITFQRELKDVLRKHLLPVHKQQQP